MKGAIFAVGMIIILFVCPAYASLPYYGAQSDSTDPVEFAVQEMQRMRALWTPEMYASVYGVYKIGAPIAGAGGAYILLQSPSLASDLVNGGFIKAGISIAFDALLVMVDKMAKSPKEICRGISKEVIERGWEDYKKAYHIAARYRKSKTLSRAQALEFLRCRFGASRMGLARILNEEISTARFSSSAGILEEAAEEITDHFNVVYQHKIGLDGKLPLIQAAFFVRDAADILEQKKAGLMNYAPYLKFIRNMEEINEHTLKEMRRFGAAFSASTATAAPPPARPSEPTPKPHEAEAGSAAPMAPEPSRGGTERPAARPAPRQTEAGSSGRRVIFYDDFEGGARSEWREVEPTVRVTSANPRSGDRSLQLADDTSKTADVILRLDNDSPRLGIEFWEWTNDFGWSGGTHYHLETKEASGYVWCFMFGAQTYTEGKWRYIDQQDKRIQDAENPFLKTDRDFPFPVRAERNSWHKIRVEIYGPEGRARFWYDDIFRGEVAIAPTSRPIRVFRHYVGWSSPRSAVNYIDDVRIYVPSPYGENIGRRP